LTVLALIPTLLPQGEGLKLPPVFGGAPSGYKREENATAVSGEGAFMIMGNMLSNLWVDEIQSDEK